MTLASTWIVFFIVLAHVLLLLWQLESFHRLTMGKVEIGIYFCITADILTKVLQKCSWSSPLQTIWILSKSLILIGCHGNQNVKLKKNIFIRGMKLKFYINVCVIIQVVLHNFVFYCCWACGFIAMATLSFHRFIMGNVKVGLNLYLTLGSLTKTLQ